MTAEWSAAVASGDLEGIRRLLDAGADVNARDRHGQTALMNASGDGRVAVVRLLVERGASLNVSAKYGLTALMLATLRGHADTVRVLLDAGADQGCRGSGAPGFDGKTALDLAKDRQDSAIVPLLGGVSSAEARLALAESAFAGAAPTPPSVPTGVPPSDAADPVSRAHTLPANARPADRDRGLRSMGATIDGEQAARWAALLTALVVALYLCWQIIQPFVNVLLWAVVLAIVFTPIHRRIDAVLQRPWLTAAVSTILVIFTIVGPVSFITVAVVAELRFAATTLGSGPLLDPESPTFGPFVRWLGQYVDLVQLQSPEFLRARLDEWSGTLANGTLGLVGGVASAAIQTVLVVFTLYYLFRDGDAIRGALYDVMPIDRARTRAIINRTKEVVAASVYGVIVIAAIQGTLGFFIFWILGLPSPLLWGVVMFVLCMIPMAGAFLVWVPAALYLAVTGAWVKALILTAWGMLVVGSIDNFLSPRLIGRRTRMHELLVFFGVLGGLDVFGVIGVILGPVVIAITLALLEIVRQANRPASETLTEPTLVERQGEVRQAS